jgi:hypothetical protein
VYPEHIYTQPIYRNEGKKAFSIPNDEDTVEDAEDIPEFFSN